MYKFYNEHILCYRDIHVVETSTNEHTKFYKHVWKRSYQTHNRARYVRGYSTIQCKCYMHVIIVANIIIYKI